ncbi:uncharacterized protein N7482_000782 [Penicillium canariense]|uniref:C2H2-type domain-containing protein n=1 Tax=Penicillium canariense TaxID=189055 RepID=A0A9W9LSZ1_9EURO|nr:uncharacterized protein N7482_000782 [Penicillium canariense]KAJ5174905.1 hypothetical protein N7482_000782 [Penicillium canariense]
MNSPRIWCAISAPADPSPSSLIPTPKFVVVLTPPHHYLSSYLLVRLFDVNMPLWTCVTLAMPIKTTFLWCMHFLRTVIKNSQPGNDVPLEISYVLELECGKRFSAKMTANQHAKSVHDHVRWPCSRAEEMDCDKTFTAKGECILVGNHFRGNVLVAFQLLCTWAGPFDVVVYLLSMLLCNPCCGIPHRPSCVKVVSPGTRHAFLYVSLGFFLLVTPRGTQGDHFPRHDCFRRSMGLLPLSEVAPCLPGDDVFVAWAKAKLTFHSHISQAVRDYFVQDPTEDVQQWLDQMDADFPLYLEEI